MEPNEVEGYCRTLTDLREEYKKDIAIKIGFECEYYPAVFEKTIAFMQDYPIDYLIMGQHNLDNEYDTHDSVYAGSDSEERLEKYIHQVLTGMETGKYTYLAHPDMYRFTGEDSVYEAHIRPFCEKLKALGIPVEFNLLGFAEGRSYPSDRFFRIAKSVGNDVIIGCDAHTPKAVGNPEVVTRAEAYLKEKLGITPIPDVRLRPVVEGK